MKPTTAPRLALAAALALVLAAAPSALAASYIVTLNGGDTFESRYKPETASWDDGLVLLLTEYGNWIAIENADIADVTTDVESRGFGKVIDTKTISLGILPNDAVDPSEQEPPTQAEILQNFLLQQQQNQPDYTVNQFVEPGSAGIGGLPVGSATNSASPLLIGP